MRSGGLISVQPGIESLSTHVLKLMKKHSTGMRNLELMTYDAVSSPADIAVVVALLHDHVDLGVHSVDDVVRRIRLGRHALMAVQDDRSALFLPSVVSRFNLDGAAFAEQLLDKAGITEPPYR
jgi:hypothetical protein